MNDYSFPKDRRLTRDKEVQTVFDEGDFFKGDYCHLIRGEYDPDSITRVAFVVSQKTASKSTERNRIKRLMRESYRLKLPELEEGWPLIFLATREAHGDLKRQDIDSDLDALLKKADLVQGEKISEDSSP